jgi:hypothetical protein
MCVFLCDLLRLHSEPALSFSNGPEGCDPFRHRPEQREGMTASITFQHSDTAYVKRVRALRMSFFLEIWQIKGVRYISTGRHRAEFEHRESSIYVHAMR